MQNALELKNICKIFGDVKALDDISFEVKKGEWVSVMGPSGSGKSTLVNILSLMDTPSSGVYMLGGDDASNLNADDTLKFRREKIGLIFQQFHLVPYLSALENVMIAQYYHSSVDEEDAKKALEAGCDIDMMGGNYSRFLDELIENGEVEFRFSEFSAPYVFALRSQFYSFKLAELAQIKSKYAIILMKLWEANRFKNQRCTTIQGNLEEWQDWFLGEDRRMPPAIFARNCLKVGAEELEKKLGVDVYLDVVKNGRKVIGYEMQLVDNRQVTTAELIKEAEKNSYQTDVHDFI